MYDLVFPALALLTIALGLFGLVAPRYTAGALDLETTRSTMGLSELRASAGGLFVAMGIVCLWTGDPGAYAMLGVAYAGAATGRLASIFIDNPPKRKAFVFFLFEAVPAAILIAPVLTNR
ncbi:DUF4345 family protein [Thalassococcus sp. CAU 1522]|uniref:DUF4345 family protein n=1 Tax=Thalassococcus arenae TaxID=2851652 RepID=A0ABS6NB64_9RHOB|nr:DUF4345 family protein [Thalassococcus arenae]MBV2360917.1 DUF4345 family protein [Thalassococcus arenae]